MFAADASAGSASPGSWVGCYESRGPAFGGGGARQPGMEVRQDGGTLYMSMGMEGRHEQRLLWAPASPRQLRLMKESVGGREQDAIEVTSGLVMRGAANGPVVSDLREDEIAMGFWWIRGVEIEGDPMGHLPRTRETLRTSKEALYFTGVGAFEKAGKVPCPVPN